VKERKKSKKKPSSSMRTHLRLQVGKDEAGMRLDRFLAKRCHWRSRTKIEELIEGGEVELVGRVARSSRKVHEGEVVAVKLPRPKRELDLHAAGPPKGLKVLFEDECLIAVDKPPDIPVHPGGRLLEDTVITRLQERYRAEAVRAAKVWRSEEDEAGAGRSAETRSKPGEAGSGTGFDDEDVIVPKLCHRLDLETSGVLLVAKTDAVAAEMGRQMRRRETIKEYLAIVHGTVKDDEFVIDAPIGKHPASLIGNRRAVVPDGVASKTGVKVERRFERDGEEFTLVRCRLYTGRRHQIRCHLHHAGYPVVGDKVYGLDEEFFLAYYEERLDAELLRRLILPRQALHAARLVVTHPKKKTPLEVEAPLPADLREFVEA
jgi:23S rRNA pseudouridine1911/1915/1917 synthase